MTLIRFKHDTIFSLGVRLLACAFAVALVCGILPGNAFADVRKADIVSGSTVEQRGLTVAQCPSIDAEYACVMDKDGTVYFERDADTETNIASITKVMTCLVSLDYGKAEDEITVSAKAAEIGESSANLQEGDKTDFVSMLKALMIPSGNDAAVALAEYYGQRILEQEGRDGVLDESACIAAFVEKMNEKAAAIGMTNTLFENPHGLDDGVYEGDLHSTARDVALMVRYGMQNQQFRDVCGIDGADITVTRDGEQVSITLDPTDTMLETYEGAIGVKTGYTDSAGACFAGASARGDQEVYAIVLKSPDEQSRFDDAETCMDWYYDNFVTVNVANSSVSSVMNVSGDSITVPVVAYAAHSGWVDCTFPVTLENPNQTVTVFQLNGNLTQEIKMDEVTGDIHPGDKVGTIVLYQHNQQVASANLVACTYQSGPNPIESIGVAVDRFIRGLSNQSTVAKTETLNTMPVFLDKTT